MFNPASTNRDEKEDDNVKRDEKEEQKLITTQSSNDDSNNQSNKVSATTADNDNQNHPSGKRLKKIDDSNIHRPEETTDNIINDEELNDSLIKQYLQNLHFYDNKHQRIIKFNSLFKFGQETLQQKLTVQYNSSINILRKSILTNLYLLYANDQWNLSTLKKISTLLDNSIDHYLEAELLLILHISKFKRENVTKIQEIIEHVIPIQTAEQEIILNALRLNLNIIDELKIVLLSNQIIRIIEKIYFTLTKKQIDKNDLKQIINDIHIEFVRVRRAPQLRGFSGRKKIYVNADHFLLQYKYDNPSPPLELLQLNLLTLIFHESMDTILCDIENNYNLTRPSDYAEANVEESGVYVEKYVFSCCPDWVEIYKNNIISLPEINSILDAFKTDQSVSTFLPQDLNFSVRNVSIMVLDITSIDFGKSWEV